VKTIREWAFRGLLQRTAAPSPEGGWRIRPPEIGKFPLNRVGHYLDVDFGELPPSQLIASSKIFPSIFHIRFR
jgi:hypothetical protein